MSRSYSTKEVEWDYDSVPNHTEDTTDEMDTTETAAKAAPETTTSSDANATTNTIVPDASTTKNTIVPDASTNTSVPEASAVSTLSSSKCSTMHIPVGVKPTAPSVPCMAETIKSLIDTFSEAELMGAVRQLAAANPVFSGL